MKRHSVKTFAGTSSPDHGLDPGDAFWRRRRIDQTFVFRKEVHMRIHRRATAIAFVAIAALVVLVFAPVAAQAAGTAGHFHHGPGNGSGHGHWHHHSHWGWGVGIGFGFGPYYAPGWYPAPVVVVPQVIDEPLPMVSMPPEPVIEPRQGQSAAQVEADRQACNRWATTQASAMADASVFHRMTLSCMEGRGYSVR